MAMDNLSMLLTPSNHAMQLRTRTPKKVKNTSLIADKSVDISVKECGGLLTGRAPLRTVNSALVDIGTTAARKLRTVKRAWGTFKAKLKPRIASKRQRLWNVATIPTACTPGGRYRVLNSPISPSLYQTPKTRRYRHLESRNPDTPAPVTFATPETEMTPLNLSMVSITSTMRRSARISRRMLGSEQGTARSRFTPRRSITSSHSPGRFQRDLDSVTSQMGQLAPAMQAFQSMEDSFSKTIEKQDSNSTLVELPIQPPAEQQNSPKCLGRRSSQRISKRLLKHLAINVDSDVDETMTPKSDVCYEVQQRRLV